MKATAIIIGPKDTPYDKWYFVFHLKFHSKLSIFSTKVGYYLSHSRYRIHPNLYVGRSKDNFIGKVCLSSINTWSGPKWTSVMHIGSVLLSIQSLLCNNPLHNEPGFENEKGKRNDTYNQMVQYDTYNHLIKTNGFNIHPLFQCFNDIIVNHFKKEKETILNKLDKLCELNPQVIKLSINIYNLMMILDYKKLKEIYLKLHSL